MLMYSCRTLYFLQDPDDNTKWIACHKKDKDGMQLQQAMRLKLFPKCIDDLGIAIVCRRDLEDTPSTGRIKASDNNRHRRFEDRLKGGGFQ